ncbi:hypothetical protein [Magnetococcus sp. PR-3]|uniref:hypothetical protein n=1 Tax=Magnetococcus sp. PR-3 TaxID=3120355 RepID=UPI003FA561FF
MAQRGNGWLTPMIFEGSCHAPLVEVWIKKMLWPQLKEPSVIVMDKASFHNKWCMTVKYWQEKVMYASRSPRTAQISTLLSKHSHS